jgi:hypothetical protein
VFVGSSTPAKQGVPPGAETAAAHLEVRVRIFLLQDKLHGFFNVDEELAGFVGRLVCSWRVISLQFPPPSSFENAPCDMRRLRVPWS